MSPKLAVIVSAVSVLAIGGYVIWCGYYRENKVEGITMAAMEGVLIGLSMALFVNR